jgi:hypothetical protein
MGMGMGVDVHRRRRRRRLVVRKMRVVNSACRDRSSDGDRQGARLSTGHKDLADGWHAGDEWKGPQPSERSGRFPHPADRNVQKRADNRRIKMRSGAREQFRSGGLW